ncbi:MAG TPA: carbon storage regulator CsrA [Syntrophomonadaceae bacterium]|nr:carbon storage regulator CsrA [Syntrophomonadaceae bacterium]
MLVLSRKKGESIIIGENIEITIVEIQGDVIRLGIEAPREISIYRQELWEEIKKSNQEATQTVEKLGDKLDLLKEIKRPAKNE